MWSSMLMSHFGFLGKILSVETVCAPDKAGKRDSLLWRDTHVNAGRCRYNVFLRVVFVEGTPVQESIGFIFLWA